MTPTHHLDKAGKDYEKFPNMFRVTWSHRTIISAIVGCAMKTHTQIVNGI